jgi:hypothetical protein
MNKTSTLIHKEQIELSFDASCRFQPVIRRQRRPGRAQWWFQQMRAVVDRALDWQPAPPPRPEQIYLTLARGR